MQALASPTPGTSIVSAPEPKAPELTQYSYDEKLGKHWEIHYTDIDRSGSLLSLMMAVFGVINT